MKNNISSFTSKISSFLVLIFLAAFSMNAAAVSVKDPPYSATGNGTTDDAAAFQHALSDISMTGGGVVFVPTGTYYIGSTLSISDNTTLQGSGENATVLQSHASGAPLISVKGNYAKVNSMSLRWAGSSAATSGTVGLYSAYNGSAGTLRAKDFEYRNLSVVAFYDNIYIDGAPDDGIVTNIITTNAEHDGIVGLGAQGYWNNLVIIANKGDGIYLGFSSLSNSGNLAFMSGIQTYANGGWGIHTVSNIFLSGTPSYLNNDSLGELLVDGGSQADSGHVANADIQYAGQNPFAPQSGYTNVSNAPGVHVTSNAGPVRFTDVSLLGNNGNGLWLEGSQAQVSNARILGSAKGGSGYCVLNASVQSQITNVECNTPSLVSATDAIIRGNHFTVNSALPALQITSGSDLIVADNVFYNGSGNSALSISSGVTLAKAYNMVIGTMSNSGSPSGYYTPTFP